MRRRHQRFRCAPLFLFHQKMAQGANDALLVFSGFQRTAPFEQGFHSRPPFGCRARGGRSEACRLAHGRALCWWTRSLSAVCCVVVEPDCVWSFLCLQPSALRRRPRQQMTPNDEDHVALFLGRHEKPPRDATHIEGHTHTGRKKRHRRAEPRLRWRRRQRSCAPCIASACAPAGAFGRSCGPPTSCS